MTVTRSLLVSVLLAGVALPALASSSAIKSSWNTGVMRTQDGKFAYCVSEAQYDNGLWLILALNPGGDVNIGVGQKGAQLPVGGQRNSTLQVDAQTAVQLPARVVKPELYVLNAGKNAALLQAFAAGTTVTIDGNSFSLSGSGGAVSTLKECVQVSTAAPATPAGQPQAQAAQPAAPNDWVVPGQAAVAQTAPAQPVTPQVTFDGEPPAAMAAAPEQPAQTLQPPALTAEPPPADMAESAIPVITADPAPVAPPPVQEQLVEVAPSPADVVPPPAVTPDLTVAAQQAVSPPVPAATPAVRPLPAQLNSLLVKAGVRDIEPAAAADGNKFAWISRTMKGSIRELTVTPGSNLARLVDRELQRMKTACAVEFTSWPGASPAETAGALQLMTAQTRCRGNGRSDYSTHVFALTRGGVLSVISHETPGGTRAAADRAQSGLINALKGIQG